MPTYFVYHSEVPCSNWSLGSHFPLKTSPGELLSGAWRLDANTSRWDALLPAGLSVSQLSLLSPGLAVTANTSEIYHSGIMLTDKAGGAAALPARRAAPGRAADAASPTRRLAASALPGDGRQVARVLAPLLAAQGQGEGGLDHAARARADALRGVAKGGDRLHLRPADRSPHRRATDVHRRATARRRRLTAASQPATAASPLPSRRRRLTAASPPTHCCEPAAAAAAAAASHYCTAAPPALPRRRPSFRRPAAPPCVRGPALTPALHRRPTARRAGQARQGPGDGGAREEAEPAPLHARCVQVRLQLRPRLRPGRSPAHTGHSSVARHHTFSSPPGVCVWLVYMQPPTIAFSSKRARTPIRAPRTKTSAQSTGSDLLREL